MVEPALHRSIRCEVGRLQPRRGPTHPHFGQTHRRHELRSFGRVGEEILGTIGSEADSERVLGRASANRSAAPQCTSGPVPAIAIHPRSPPVVHRDLKGANLLVGVDMSVKLADFGCSKWSDDTKSFTTLGSIPWMAPEVIKQIEGHGRKADLDGHTPPEFSELANCANARLSTARGRQNSASAKFIGHNTKREKTRSRIRRNMFDSDIAPPPTLWGSALACSIGERLRGSPRFGHGRTRARREECSNICLNICAQGCDSGLLRRFRLGLCQRSWLWGCGLIRPSSAKTARNSQIISGIKCRARTYTLELATESFQFVGLALDGASSST